MCIDVIEKHGIYLYSGQVLLNGINENFYYHHYYIINVNLADCNKHIASLSVNSLPPDVTIYFWNISEHLP